MDQVGGLVFGEYSVQEYPRAYYVAIPKVVAKSLGIEKGTKVCWTYVDGKLVLQIIK